MKTNRPLLTKLLLGYGNLFPYHSGKATLHNWLRRVFQIEVTGETEVTRRGLRWQLDPEDCMQSPLFWVSTRDRWGLHHLTQHLPSGAVVFDVGANFGYYSLTIAAHLKRNCQVYAFEPQRGTFQRLQTNIVLNQLEHVVHCHCLGLSDQESQAQLVIKPGNYGATFVSTQADGESIRLTTMDGFCAVHKVNRLDLIKCDVEGFEERVLRGGYQMIQEHQPVIYIEINPPTLHRAGTSAANLVNLLRGFGYDLMRIQHHHLVPLPEIPQGEDYEDCFCLPRGKR
ncbi:MAG: hypothetical protein PCFJNLEI_01866 [Verrucomicrobiae bacterium]|nr:hypothetical protein [Verrucomicrobiae bacterium]